MIHPWWPVVGLAGVQLVDAVMCVGPVPFIARCLEDVHFPRRYWPLLPLLKLAAAAGLVVGVWLEPLAILTAGCLVAYFVVAVAMHIRARDFGRNMFVNAGGMLATCIAALTFVISQA